MQKLTYFRRFMLSFFAKRAVLPVSSVYISTGGSVPSPSSLAVTLRWRGEKEEVKKRAANPKLLFSLFV